MLRVGHLARDRCGPPACLVRRGGEQGARVGMRHRREHRAGRARLHHPPRIHHHHPRGRGTHHAEIVGDQQQREPLLRREFAEQVEHLRLHRDVERGGRLVGDQQLGAAGERDRDHHALALAAGELVRIAVARIASAGEADAVEQPARPCAPPRAGPGADAAAAARRSARRSVFSGLSAVIGSWNTMPMPPAADRAQVRLRCGEQVARRRTSTRPAVARARRQQAHDRQRRHRLAAAASRRPGRRSRRGRR